jgi:flagellar basal-body rod modification protein FlgD
VSTTFQALPIASTTATAATKGKSVLGKDDFLNLLIVQLRNQDPLDPMKGTEFATQLAQFSSLEQLTNINTNLTESVTTNQLMAQSIGNSLAATMIGKSVKASSNTFMVTATGDSRLGYTLARDAASVTIKISDATGLRVRTITIDGAKQGDGTYSWDGLNDTGNRVAAGTYTFTVEGADSAGVAVSATTSLSGLVSAIRFTANGTVFVVDGVEIPLSQIIEILNGKGNG